MRKKFVAGNWKMNKTFLDSKQLIKEIKDGISRDELIKIEVVLFPPFTSLGIANDILKGSGIGYGAQNIHQKEEGAYTGEISASMIKSLGCEYVILGHSERRQYFGEVNHLINLKVKTALKNELTPILCVGETLDERENGVYKKIVDEQVTLCLKEISKEDMLKIVIAYEPVWAIGTGKTASPEQAEEMHIEIRSALYNLYGKEIADKIRILYGGSVNDKNSKEIFSKPNIDGGLIGGASLKADSFLTIIKSAVN